MQSNLSDYLLEAIKNDPLYAEIAGTTLETQFWNEEYLNVLEEKRWYSTVEIAEWFGINDGQLRYYIKPFHDYLFTEDTPSSSTAYRLNAEAVIKLRMILLLKDEHKVKGLLRLIGLGEGYVQKKPSNANNTMPADPHPLEKQVANLSFLMEQIMKTGMFEITQGESGSEISVREDFLNDRLKRITGESTAEAAVAKVNEVSEKLEQENTDLREELRKLRENRKEDIAIRMRERRIEMELVAELRAEALEKWSEQNKASFFGKLFRSEQIEIEKEKFINDYTKQNLTERYDNAINAYRNNDSEDLPNDE